jgi:hypothetical protein
MLRHLLLTTACGAALVAPGRAAAAAEPHRSFYDLPSSNGWGAVVVDLSRGRAHHWRDHLFATEEPRIDAAGAEVWSGDLPESVAARDLLFDAYFGLRADGQQQWLTDLPVDLEASGWVPGTNLVQMRQQLGDLALTTTAWAPWELPRSAAALVLTVENTGSVPVAGLSAFSLQNLHLGEGRPGPTSETGAQNETVVLDEGSGHIEERGFAGVVSTWPLRQPAAVSAWYPGAPTPNPWEVVQGGGAVDFVAGAGDQGVHDDSVSYIRWDHGPLAPGEVARFGLVMAHHGDPFSVAALSAEVQAWIAGREPGAVLADEEAAWQAFQGAVVVPAALTPDEEALYRHSAVVLRMAQVRETEAYLRQWLRSDGEPRYSAFGGPLPSVVPHKAAGGVLASLPPGQWTYAWPRDGAYAVVGMAYAGMQGEAREALRYLLDADTDRYRTYQELAGVPVLPYSISLCRHHGFGIEESDTLGGGDFNFEFDGAGLFLWALDHYGRATGDWSLLQERWEPIRDRVAAFLVALIDPVSGLIHEDSSIWEHHWLGKERTWAYTSITAARGLCAAADFADRQGETALAEAWRGDATRIRDGLLASLQAPDRSIAQTREELAAGAGYADGAVIEAVAMGLLDPAGAVGPATLQALVDALQTDDGPGLSRNDDAWDPHDLSPWGSSYDSDEWVVIDLRTAVAARDLGDPILADALVDWITDQSTSNFLAIGETYDPVTGDYTNNAPMVGFGAGAYIAALNHRAGVLVEGPACGEFPAEPLPGDDDEPTDDDDATDEGEPTDDDDAADDDEPTDDDDAVSPTGCGCAAGAARPGAAGLLVLVMLLGLSLRRARC